MASQIKGLSQFIADLRTTSTPEAEKARVQAELASLRRKLAGTKSGKELASKSKAGYEYRKVVSKLLYIYILGYDVDLGRDEVNVLLQMPKFAEKQVGYLALSLLLHARNDLQRKIEPIVEADLRSPKEVMTSLALNYVSSFDLKTQPVSEQLENLVYQLMVSPTSSSAVAKKAALTFLNFYRQDPARFYTESDWPERVERMVAILVDPNRGVAVSMAPLLLHIAQTSSESIPSSVTRAIIQKLDDAFEASGSPSDHADEYTYYHIAAPWLVAKLCQMLTFLPLDSPDLVESCRATVSSILAYCIDDMEEPDSSNSNLFPSSDGTKNTSNNPQNTSPGSQQHRNALSLVFLDALKLANALHVEKWNQELTIAALQIVKSLFSAKDPNMRYVALEAVQSFATPLPRTTGKPRQISLRLRFLGRQASNSSVPGSANSTFNDKSSPDVSTATVTQESTQEDLDVIKVVLGLVKDRDIAVRQQALDALYKLVDQQSVELAAAELLDMLVSSDLQIRPQMVSRLAALIERFATSHEWYFDTSISLLVIGGAYASDEVWQRLAQVVVNNQALHAYAVKRIKESLSDARELYSSRKANSTGNCEPITKLGAFILGEFASSYNGDPLDLFLVLQDQISNAPWSTRSVLLSAYIKFAARFPNMRPAVVEALSVYLDVPDLESQQRAVEYLALLNPVNADVLGLFLEPMPPFGAESSSLLFQQMGHSGQYQSSKPSMPSMPLQPLTSSSQPAMPEAPLSASKTGNAGFASQGNNGNKIVIKPRSSSLATNGSGRSALSATPTGSSVRPQHLSSNWEFGFKRMLTQPKAVLYQDAILQIGCQYQFSGSRGTISLYIKNVSSFEVSSLSMAVHNPMSEETFSIKASVPSASSLDAGQSVESVVICEAKQPFALSPSCRITYYASTFGEMTFRLPVVLERFMSPSVPITLEQFNHRWDQVGSEFEFTKTLRNYSASKGMHSVDDDRAVLEGLQYGVVPNTGNGGPYMGAGIIHTSVGGMFGCLAILRADATRQTYEVTVRATRKKLAAVVLANDISQVYQL